MHDMGGPSEREYREKLNKILENTNKAANDVRGKFVNIQKIKVDALKKPKTSNARQTVKETKQ